MNVDQNNSLATAMATLYCGIDLHANNHVICVINDKDQRLLETKCDNHLELTLKALSRYKKRLNGIAIESTFNWCWLISRPRRGLEREWGSVCPLLFP